MHRSDLLAKKKHGDQGQEKVDEMSYDYRIVNSLLTIFIIFDCQSAVHWKQVLGKAEGYKHAAN